MVRSEWLASFVTFAEDANFTRAALRLHISQPALHVQVRRLGEELGVPLYVRSGRGLTLTREGVEVLAYAREQLRADGELRDRLAGGRHRGRVVLAAGEGVYRFLLGPALQAFARTGAAELTLVTRDREGAIAAVLSGEAHLAVATEAGDERVHAAPIASVPQVLVVPKSHRLARRRRTSARDLHGETLILPPRGRPLRAAVDGLLLSMSVNARIAAEASGWELLLHFASLGLGLTIVNGFCRMPAGLVARPFVDLPPVGYALLSRPHAREDDATRSLRHAILTRAQRGAPPG